MLVKGNRIRQEKIIGDFDYVGTVFDVTNITPNGIICFSNRRLGTGMMSHEEFTQHFVKTKWSDWDTLNDGDGAFQYKTDGKRVVTRRGSLKASASCNTMDTFNLYEGIQLSLARLRVKELVSKMEKK